MKKLSLVFLSVIASLTMSAQEWVSASIGNSAIPTHVDLFIQSSNPFDANKVDNLVFTIRIPKTGGSNVVVSEVTAGHSAAFSHITFTIVKYGVDDGVYYYYLVNGIGSVQAAAGTTISNTSTKVLELEFTGGTTGMVELVNLPNGLVGNNGALIEPQFYIQNNNGPIVNNTTTFYGTAGAIPHNLEGANGDSWVPTASLVSLPVSFRSYDVKCNDRGALLTWSTSTEQNSNRFEIQRSENGTDWVTIDRVTAAGNSADIRNYQYLDLAGGVAFYRLRQVDNDGRFIYTDIKRTDCKARFEVSLYPVPAKDKLTVVVKSDIAVKTDLQIHDMTGRIVSRITTQINKGNNNIVLNVNELPGGQYMLTSSEASVIINKKFTISR